MSATTQNKPNPSKKTGSSKTKASPPKKDISSEKKPVLSQLNMVTPDKRMPSAQELDELREFLLTTGPENKERVDFQINKNKGRHIIMIDGFRKRPISRFNPATSGGCDFLFSKHDIVMTVPPGFAAAEQGDEIIVTVPRAFYAGNKTARAQGVQKETPKNKKQQQKKSDVKKSK